LSVSGSPTSVMAVNASLNGGTLIYINVIGHSPNPSDNLIFIGGFQCNIPSDGVTDTFITCETTNTGSTKSIYGLTLSLISSG
jgi:hypothetical protein